MIWGKSQSMVKPYPYVLTRLGDAVMTRQTAKILVIDDHEPLLKMVKRGFTRVGYEVHAIPHASTALELLQKEPFNLVLTDLRMPNINGIDLLRQIRAKHPQMSVIMMTGDGSEEMAVSFMREGGTDYIAKPLDAEKLLSKISQALELPAVQQVALHHHEKWDGSGYPRGLSGKEIPLSARIVAIADVFDALTMIRPYKTAWSIEKSMAEIARGSGAHFDLELVK